MRSTVVLTAAFPSIARDILSAEFDVIEHPTEHDRSEADMMSILSEADGAVTLLSDPISREVLASNPNLRVVANFAVGYNNIDVAAARDLGIRITHTPGVLTEATADLTMALLLAVARRIVEADRLLRAEQRCEWDPLQLLGCSLQGKRLGIVGMGRIGQAVAHRAAAFGLVVRGIRRGEPLRPLLESSDILSLHLPLTAETRHIIDGRALEALPHGAILVNTSRGALVDEQALCTALEAGQLSGAGLDVYEHEPVVHPRLLTLRNVVVLPHIGSATVEARAAMARIAATDVARVLRGVEPLHPVV